MDGRRERSRATRRRLVEAAYSAFCARGLGVPLTEIAAEAGVSVQTIYVTFSTKTELLRAALQYAVHGDDLPIPPHHRPWFGRMVAEPDPRRAIEILLRGTQGIYDRVGPLVGVFRTTDPDVAQMWQHSEQLRYDGMHLMTQALVKKGRLRRGVTTRTATDIVFVLLSPDSYQSFVGLGWSASRWRTWVIDTVATALFEPV
jgi:AcrR family transcriptional regulator